MYFKRHCSGEQAPALRNKKENFYFYFLHTFDRKSISKPVLKIFIPMILSQYQQIFVKRYFRSGKACALKGI